MKKIIITLCSLFLFINSNFVIANGIPNRIPDELSITEHWLSLTTSYDIETKTQKLGTLYRRLISLLLTYDFYDPFDNKLAYARSKFFSFTAHFDVYDTNENFLGAADEHLFAFFPTFDIFARDGYTKLATASMNFWGTIFHIYDPSTNKEMATMSRSFFRLKNDWTFRVTDRNLFDQKGIDPRVMLTVIAFQGDREYWESQNKKNYFKGIINDKNAVQLTDISGAQINSLLDKVAAVAKHEGLENEQPTEQTAAIVATELENGYLQNTQTADSSVQTSQDRLSSFTDYCLNLVQTNTLSNEKKSIILFLLKSRLESVKN